MNAILKFGGELFTPGLELAPFVGSDIFRPLQTSSLTNFVYIFHT